MRTFGLWLCLAALPQQSLGQEANTLRFAFSDGDPPTSFASGRQPMGLLPELTQALFDHIPNIDIEMQAYPWQRAKLLAKNAKIDALVTFPGKTLSAHLVFTEQPVYISDFGYLIFKRSHPKATALAGVKTATDLSDFIMLTDSQPGEVSWERENIPVSVHRLHVNDTKTLMHMLFRREAGDFFIRNLEEARHLANTLGYGPSLQYKKIDFLQSQNIPFHVGIRNNHPSLEHLRSAIDQALPSTQVQAAFAEIIHKYQRQ